MNEDLRIQQIREAMRSADPDEVEQEMIRRGIIDKDGNVLVRMPVAPVRKKTRRPKPPETATN